MGWDGAGGYTRQHNFSADASAGIKILALRMDQEFNDVASAMTIAWARNGQNTPTQAVPMGGQRFINVGAATSVGNYMRVKEFIENVPIFMQDVETSADRISVSAQYFTSVSANQAPSDGTRIFVRAKSNKSSAALYLNGHSANVEYQDGNRIGPALVSGGVYEFLYSSVDAAWKLQNPDDGRTSAEVANSATVVNFQYPVGNVLRYGADPTGATDSLQAFLDALAVTDAFVPLGTYRIEGRLPLKKHGIIGEISSINGTVATSKLLSYNQTDATAGFIYTDYDNWNRRAIPIKNVFIGASSWHPATGSLGYGIDITVQVDMDNVAVMWFAKSGVFLHNTDTDGDAPYNSILKSVAAHYNGNHGIVIGTGSNVITVIQPDCKYNGAPSYQTAPSVAGSYDGFFVSRDGDGNPSSAYFSSLPESLSIMGGDCSYNSRYGWNFSQSQSGHFFTDYCEGNLQASPGQVNLGNGLRECFGIFCGVAGETAGVNFGSQATVPNLGHTNRFFVGGQDCGAGNSNTETSRYHYTLGLGFNFVAYESTQTDSAYILGSNTGVAHLASSGAGGWIVRSKTYTVATLPSAATAGQQIYVSDESGGSIFAFSDGTNWRRVTDRAIVS